MAECLSTLVSQRGVLKEDRLVILRRKSHSSSAPRLIWTRAIGSKKELSC